MSVQKPSIFFEFQQTSPDLNKIKKMPNSPLQNVNGKQKTCAKFKQKIFNSVVTEVRQSFQFFRQDTFFLENKRALSKFLFGILHYLISIIKL